MFFTGDSSIPNMFVLLMQVCQWICVLWSLMFSFCFVIQNLKNIALFP